MDCLKKAKGLLGQYIQHYTKHRAHDPSQGVSHWLALVLGVVGVRVVGRGQLDVEVREAEPNHSVLQPVAPELPDLVEVLDEDVARGLTNIHTHITWGYNFCMVDSRRVLAPAPKVLEPQTTSRTQMLPASQFDFM